MSNFKTKLIFAWMLTVLGLSLAALPLYSDLFTKKRYDSETSAGSFSTTSSVDYTMMRVSPYAPFVGGIISAFGGFLVGRLQGPVAYAKDLQPKR